MSAKLFRAPTTKRGSMDGRDDEKYMRQNYNHLIYHAFDYWFMYDQPERALNYQ
jgi:hypothetical protein